MTNVLYLLDLSGTNIKLFSNSQHPLWRLEKELWFKVGFEQDETGKIKPYFGEELKQLKSEQEGKSKALHSSPDSLEYKPSGLSILQPVIFDSLERNFKRIDDNEVTKYILKSFFDKMFENLKDISITDFYITLPFNWSAEIRTQIRELLKDYPKIKFRGFLNEILCLIISCLYLDKEELESLVKTKTTVNFFIVDLRPISPKFIYLTYSEDEKERRFAIKDIQYLNEENLVKDLCHRLEGVLKNTSTDGFVIRCFGVSEDLDKELKQWLTKTAIFKGILSISHHDDVIIDGAKKLIDILTSPTQLDKMLAIKYDFIFGIQLDAERIFEIIPKLPEDVAFPYERKKAFCVEGAPEGNRVNLYCGFSDRVDSGICISSINIKPTGGLRQRQKFDFIASIKLNDRTRGTFEVILPQENVQSEKFRVPVIRE